MADAEAGDDAAAPSLSAAAQDITITVKVGLGAKEYHLPRCLLVHYSGFFRGALSGHFQESDNRVVILELVDPGAFNTFVEYIYSGSAPDSTCNCNWETTYPYSACFGLDLTSHTQCEHDGDVHCHWDGDKDRTETLCKLKAYVLASFLLADKWKHALFEGFYNSLRYTWPWFEVVIYAYEHLPETDPLLQLLADSHCASWQPDSANKSSVALLSDLPHDFLIRVMRKLTFEKHWVNDEDYRGVERSDYKI